jgi:hypothetical protein
MGWPDNARAPRNEQTVLTFVTTIRHPDNCSSYDRVSRLLDLSLRSVCRQTDRDFRVVVVYNVMPRVEIDDTRISYVPVQFPAPSKDHTPRIDFNLFRRDKGTKCVIGSAAALQMGADHVMFFDADDLVHHRLAEHANASPGHPGWYSPQGWIHTVGSRDVQFVPTGFDHKNGSTSVIRADLLGVPNELPLDMGQEDVLDLLTPWYVERMFGDHGKWSDFLGKQGHHMEPLPFPIAIWEIGTGENLSGNLVSGRERQPIDGALTEAFGLPIPSQWSHVWSATRTTAQRLGRRLEKTVLRRRSG